MSTLDEPIWSRCSIAPTSPCRSHFQRTLNRKEGARVRMNVVAHQEKENADTGYREAGEEEGKQATDYRKAACCTYEVVWRAVRKKWFV